MTYLADVNVWLALTLYDHVHHSIAFDWFLRSYPDGIVFCRTTQMGFLRLLTNAKAMAGDPLRPAEAWALFDQVRAHEGVAFLHEPSGLEELWRKAAGNPSFGQNWCTDAYLAAFATAAGLTVVTFNRGLANRGVRTPLLG